jgi:signal transduction histidine kinase
MPSVEDMTTTAIPAPANAAPRTIFRRLGTDSAYVLLSFPLAIASFVVLVAGFSLSVGPLVLVIGVPLLAGTLLAARVFADIERLRIPPVLRVARIRPQYRTADPSEGRWRRILTPLAQGQSWLDLVHGILRLPVAVATFAVVLTWWLGAIGGTLYWTYGWAIPQSEDSKDLHELLGMADTTLNRVGLNVAVGVFFLLTLPLVARGCALLQAGFSRALLTGVAEMRDRITVLEERRAAAVSAEATALRRLERDIHDGPQQRLVRLAMDLGRAQQQLDIDPAAARETISEALTQTRETLDELRSLSRGIAPPVLVDRGLPSALAALAGRSTVPVDLAVDPALGAPDGRPDVAVEHAAYYVVAETLTNVAKHSAANGAWVTVGRGGGRLGIVVLDDGAGGAHLAKGHGLAGLADRVRAAGGTLTVTSPTGGPTEIRAELPC